MNSLSIAGYLGSDAETRFSKAGTAITSFSIPVDQGWGENKKTTWVRCILFGKKGSGDAHGLTPYLLKGKFVAVQGELVLEEWESQGKQHAMVKCVCGDVTLGPGDKSETYEEAGSRKQPPAQEDYKDDIPF